MHVHLVADVLDKQLIDVHDENAGRADGIVLQLRDGQPPLVAYVEVSPITLLRRFSRRLARWYARYDRRLGPDRGVPYRIPWSRLTDQHTTLRVDFVAEHTAIFAAEEAVRRRIERIPGASA